MKSRASPLFRVGYVTGTGPRAPAPRSPYFPCKLFKPRAYFLGSVLSTDPSVQVPTLLFLCVTLFKVARQYNKLCRAILDIKRFRSRYGSPARRKFSLATDMCRCCQRPWALVVVSTATWRCITAAMHDSAATGLAMDHQLQPRPPWWPP